MASRLMGNDLERHIPRAHSSASTLSIPAGIRSLLSRASLAINPSYTRCTTSRAAASEAPTGVARSSSRKRLGQLVGSGDEVGSAARYACQGWSAVARPMHMYVHKMTSSVHRSTQFQPAAQRHFNCTFLAFEANGWGPNLWRQFVALGQTPSVPRRAGIVCTHVERWLRSRRV